MKKIVIKVRMKCEKCRKKSMQIAASTVGVRSVEIEGEDKDHLVVIGNHDVDSVNLAKLLRKKVGRADIISQGKVEEEEEEEEEEEPETANEPKIVEYTVGYPNYYWPYCQPQPVMYII